MSEELSEFDRDRIIVEETSKWFAALANFLIPGLGYFYLKRNTDRFDVGDRGFWAVGLWLLGLLTAVIGIGILILVGLMVFVVYDCFTTVEETQIAARLETERQTQASGDIE